MATILPGDSWLVRERAARHAGAWRPRDWLGTTPTPGSFDEGTVSTSRAVSGRQGTTPFDWEGLDAGEKQVVAWGCGCRGEGGGAVAVAPGWGGRRGKDLP